MYIKNMIQKILIIIIFFGVRVEAMLPDVLVKTFDEPQDFTIRVPWHLAQEFRFLDYALSTIDDELLEQNRKQAKRDFEFEFVVGPFPAPANVTKKALLEAYSMVRKIDTLRDLEPMLVKEPYSSEEPEFMLKLVKNITKESIDHFRNKFILKASCIDEFISLIEVFEVLDLSSKYFSMILDAFVEYHKQIELENFLEIPQRFQLKIAKKYLLRYKKPIKIVNLFEFIRNEIGQGAIYTIFNGYYKSTYFCDTSRIPKADIILPDINESTGIFACDISLNYLIKNGYLANDFSMEDVDLSKINKSFWQLPNIKVKNKILQELKKVRYFNQE